MEEGDTLRVRFDDIAPRGDAIATAVTDKPIYAAGVLPGEEAEVRIRKIRRSWIAVDVLEITDPSPHRVEPRCPLFSQCSGCQLQHVEYAHQIVLKRRMVESALQRFGGFEHPPVAEPIAAAHPWNYRNHARFTVKGGRLGFIRRFRRQWLDVPQCPIMEPRINAVLERLQGRLVNMNQCNIRVGATEDDLMIQPTLDLPDEVLPSGQPHLYESVLGRRFRVSAASFFQVHRAQAEQMVQLIVQRLGNDPGATVVDAYAGVGTFAVLLAESVGRVIAIEESGPAVRDAALNIEGISNIEYRLGRTEDILGQVTERVDAVILDPPRSGCRPGALEAVRALQPKRVLYVSCDPTSLGRDLNALTQDEGGFVLRDIQPVDMFPHTYHVECVATLDRQA
jgi:23S rRNA (uracil1939-C5)-methyltransferase